VYEDKEVLEFTENSNSKKKSIVTFKLRKFFYSLKRNLFVLCFGKKKQQGIV